MVDNNKTICPLAWNGLHLDLTGKISPCCNFDTESTPKDYNINYSNLMEHPFIEDVRKKMQEGELIPNCNKCYRDEEIRGDSLRTITIKNMQTYFEKVLDTPAIFDNNTPSLKYLDLNFNNICNLKCRMCNPSYSTSWYVDAKKLGLPIPRGVIAHNDPLNGVDLKNLAYIKIAGGEPTMEQEKIISLLERTQIENIGIVIVTNCTILPNKRLFDLLKKCQRVHWIISIDALGPLNDFLRKNSNWEEIEKNLKWYDENFVDIIVHSVVSIYNINCFTDLIDYIKEKFPKITHNHAMAETNYGGDNWMDPCHLPDSVKEFLLEKNKIDEQKYGRDIFYAVEKSLRTSGNFQEFLKVDEKLNQIRNEHWKNYNRELFNLISVTEKQQKSLTL
jgi:MoaA/NifB/PqqE/SkfB family radical SAM enzyme